MGRNEKIILLGLGGIGLVALYRKIVSPKSGEAGEGQFGGSDEDLLEQQGFDIDPNVSYTEMDQYDPYAEIGFPQAEAETPITPEPGSPTKPEYISEEPIVRKPYEMVAMPSDVQPSASDITLPQYGLGILGLTGSYASALGKTTGEKVAKKLKGVPVEGAETLLKRTAKAGVEDIPFAGKKAVGFVFDKPAVELAQTGIKAVAKKGVKQTAKIGLSALPFVGLVSGAEFDIAVDKRSRPLAYTANIAGDILGALAVVGGALVGVSETGVGAVGLGVAGQVAGEQAVYKTADIFGFGKKDEQQYLPEAMPTPYFFEDVKTTKTKEKTDNLLLSNIPSSGSKNDKVSAEPIISTTGLGAGTNKALIINKAIKQGYSVKEAQNIADKAVAKKTFIKKSSKKKKKSSKKTASTKPKTTTKTAIKVKKVSTGTRDLRASSYKKKAKKRRTK